MRITWLKRAKAMKKLQVQDQLVTLSRINQDDYLSLTDIARVKNPDEPKDVVKNWYVREARSSFLACGRSSTIQRLKGSNSTPLSSRPVATVLRFRPTSGLRRLAQSACAAPQGGMAARLLIRTLPLSSLPGCLPNSSYS